MLEVDEIHCVAGSGIRGDRFFNFKENYKGQITFFSDEVFRSLCDEFEIRDKPPSVLRRNVIVQGAGLNSLVGQEFELEGIRFAGVEECKPCHWMDKALCRGAERAMRGRGGLRARILTSGILRVSPNARTVDDLFRVYTSPRLAIA